MIYLNQHFLFYSKTCASIIKGILYQDKDATTSVRLLPACMRRRKKHLFKDSEYYFQPSYAIMMSPLSARACMYIRDGWGAVFGVWDIPNLWVQMFSRDEFSERKVLLFSPRMDGGGWCDGKFACLCVSLNVSHGLRKQTHLEKDILEADRRCCFPVTPCTYRHTHTHSQTHSTSSPRFYFLTK